MPHELHFHYVAHPEVPKWEALGWVSEGPTPGHHGAYSTYMRWAGEGEPICGPQAKKPSSIDEAVKASTARADKGEVVLSFVTESGFHCYRISADNLASHIGRCARAMSDLAK